MKYKIAVVIIVMICSALFCWQCIKVLPVSEWKDVFEVDCICGNHIYVKPCDLKHYRIICAKCEKVYEKAWDVRKYE